MQISNMFSVSRLKNFYTVSVLILWVSLAFSTALFEIAFVISLAAWVFVKFREQKLLESHVIDLKLLIPITLYLFLVFLSYFSSEFPHESYRGIFKIAQQFFVVWMVYDAFKEVYAFKLFVGIVLLVLFITAVNAYYQYFLGTDLIRGYQAEHSSSGYRVTGAFKSYGLLAAYLVMVIPLVVGAADYLRSEKKSFWANAGLILAVASLGLLFFTRSRGAWLAFIFAAFLSLVILRKHKWIFIGIACVGMAYFIIPRGMIIHLDAEGKEQSIVERYYLWERAGYVIKARPLLGTGINTYDRAHQQFDRRHNRRVMGYYAHNGYLQLAAETGLPSLVLFLSFLGILLGRGLKIYATAPPNIYKSLLLGLLISVFGFLVYAGVDTVLHNAVAVFTFWFCIGLLLAVMEIIISQQDCYSGFSKIS